MDELLGLDGVDLDGAVDEEDASDDGVSGGGSGVARVAAADVSATEFARRFVATSTPAVMTDCDGEGWWPAWCTAAALTAHYGGRTVAVEGTRGTLRDFISNLDEEERYLRNVHLDDFLTKADAARLVLPPPLGENCIGNYDVPGAWRRWFELFVLPAKCRGYPFLHRDACCTSSYSMQVEGRKRFTIYRPEDQCYLYTHPPSHCRSAIEDGGHSASLDKYPLFAKARPRTVLLEPGDLMFLPPDWFHTTRGDGAAHGLTIGGNFVAPATEGPFAASYAEFQQFRALSSAGAAHIVR